MKNLFIHLFIFLSAAQSEEVHIALACDNNYLPHAGVAVKSVIDHINPENHYFFHIFSTDSLTESSLAPWEELKDKNASLPISIELREVLHVPYENEINFRHWGKASVVRLMLPDLLPTAHKVIYLDCDMIAMQDISPMLDIITKDYPLAGVIDNAAKVKPSLMKTVYAASNFHDAEYINSGLLVLDLDYLREDAFSEKTLRWLSQNPQALLPDQDCLNIVYKNKIKQLSPLYGWYSYEDLPAEPIFILHYLASSGKPWKNPYAKNTNIYFEHRAQSPWAATPIHQEQESALKKALGLGDLNEFITAYYNDNNDLLKQDKHGKTLAYEIAKSGKIEFMEFLIQEGWYQLFNVPSNAGETALHKAAQWNQPKIVSLLLERGASHSVANVHGETPFHKAHFWQAPECVAVIEAHSQTTCAADALQTPLSALMSHIKNKN